MKHMSCTINAEEFRRMLGKALKAAMKRSRIPVLAEALVRFDGYSCTITCTDLELWCQASTRSDAEPCSFVLTDSRKLLAACSYFSGDMLLSYTEDDPPKTFPARTDLNGSLVLICGDKELRQRVTTAEDFPKMPECARIGCCAKRLKVPPHTAVCEAIRLTDLAERLYGTIAWRKRG